jgi:hypothetical protein
MGKYAFAYRGGAGMAASPEEQQKSMAAWMAWFEKLGSAVVDGGAPFGASAAVSSSGKKGDAGSGLGGYSVVNAASLDEAATFAKGCPILSEGGTVDVYECIDVGM